MANNRTTGLSMPLAQDGFVQTLNQMGFMTTSLDPISQRFVDFAPHAPGPALDIGAAYGVASIRLTGAGASKISPTRPGLKAQNPY
jgi:hypothetical protein